MTSTIKVNTITTESGSTLTVGGCGKTVALASGASQTGFGRNGAVDWQTTKKTANFTATSGEGYFCDTAASGAFTLTLPSSPSAGDIVGLKDYNGNFGTANLTIGRNGSNLNGTAANKALSTNNLSLTLVYVDATEGWIPIEEGTGFVGEAFVCASVSGSCNTIVTCGDYRVAVFKGPGNFTVNSLASSSPNNNADYVVVAGGGAGGTGDPGGYTGGAGGAGGFRETKSPVTPYTASPLDGYSTPGNRITVTAQSYPIVVGAGGAGSAPKTPTAQPFYPGESGTNTSTGILPACYGGGGGGGNQPDPTGYNGGSGGGGSDGRDGGVGVYPGSSFVNAPRQGYAGGSGEPTSAGGGGGAGGAGADANGSDAGDGGAGVPYSITGITTHYAGGGGGGDRSGAGGTGGSSVGGNGVGSPWTTTAGNGVFATGSGGGGGAADPGNGSGGGGNGAGGVVIIAYPTD